MYGKVQESGLTGVIPSICISAIPGQHPAFPLGAHLREWLQPSGFWLESIVLPGCLRGLESLMTVTSSFTDMAGNTPFLKNIFSRDGSLLWWVSKELLNASWSQNHLWNFPCTLTAPSKYSCKDSSVPQSIHGPVESPGVSAHLKEGCHCILGLCLLLWRYTHTLCLTWQGSQHATPISKPSTVLVLLGFLVT